MSLKYALRLSLCRDQFSTEPELTVSIEVLPWMGPTEPFTSKTIMMTRPKWRAFNMGSNIDTT